MNKYVIITDSGADFGAAMLAECELDMVPLQVNMGSETYTDSADKKELPSKEFYQRMRDGAKATTSQANVVAFADVFVKYLEQGYDILYLGFSSGLSGTVNSGRIAAEELAVKYSPRRIEVVDTLCASLGQGLLVWHAAQKKKAGASLDEVYTWTKENVLHLSHWFTVDDLVYLQRGGRISAASAVLGSMLSIKPVMHVDNEGKLVPMEKVRGRKSSLEKMVEMMANSAINPKDQMVFISHGDCLEDAKHLQAMITERFGTTKFYIDFVGPVIGSHTGPGVLALFFMAKER